MFLHTSGLSHEFRAFLNFGKNIFFFYFLALTFPFSDSDFLFTHIFNISLIHVQVRWFPIVVPRKMLYLSDLTDTVYVNQSEKSFKEYQ